MHSRFRLFFIFAGIFPDSGRMDKTDEREAVVWAVLQNKRLAQELERVREERDLYQAWWRQAIRKEGEGDVRAMPADPL